ncbi:MAG: hypothetical protein OM95_15765 [Bdellovibrio sp. ArHS]|uniref:barstar family protein n=1 Tax=Bdellovibrio sp. ArHS TaxID=1569284 RepID=UPI000583457D|nr:barstar family protein [Bdellovibrio sp. ArHS]KHD87233.1 MAG: hypothetical protein OM95_15765 [Bdellovibrio sp. ArHS]
MKSLLVMAMWVLVSFWGLPSQAQDMDAIPGAAVYENESRITLLIYGYQVESIEQIHEIFAQAFKLPQSYGGNLDALYDVLTDPSVLKKNWDITIISGAELRVNIGDEKVDALLDVLNEAAAQDPTNSVSWWN